MNWLFPGFLAGGLLMGLPLALHFLRRRPKTVVPFPSLRFLGVTALRDTRRHQLRRWLTLLLRCLVIGCIVAAFARPFWINAAAAGRRALVIAVDNSMSMQAAGRWEAARDWASGQLDALQPGDQAAILSMHPVPAWLAPMTDDLAHVRAVLRDARPGFEKTRYAPALQLASDALAAVPAGTKTLAWMADEQRLGWLGVDLSRALPAGIKVRLAPPAPAPGRQAAIVALRRLGAGGGRRAAGRRRHGAVVRAGAGPAAGRGDRQRADARRANRFPARGRQPGGTAFHPAARRARRARFPGRTG